MFSEAKIKQYKRAANICTGTKCLNKLPLIITKVIAINTCIVIYIYIKEIVAYGRYRSHKGKYKIP
jgi:hypothetical protein